MKWLRTDVPAGVSELVTRFVIVFVVGFLVMQAKEYVDAGMFDTVATSTDSLMIAGGVVVVEMIRMLVFRRSTPKPKPTQARR